jgi:hypothetical protein
MVQDAECFGDQSFHRRRLNLAAPDNQVPSTAQLCRDPAGAQAAWIKMPRRLAVISDRRDRRQPAAPAASDGKIRAVGSAALHATGTGSTTAALYRRSAHERRAHRRTVSL